ncbi:hypothetical protein PIB30_034676 [Stylosanthes scabra]|uniref:Uncharacterized protein n=1 Tax=Stylosanthes scabra TaxID=79078 RepID=A0ABU6RDQ5_9FABA|nr:hypothetical protein [Stylosanthes scabra]
MVEVWMTLATNPYNSNSVEKWINLVSIDAKLLLVMSRPSPEELDGLFSFFKDKTLLNLVEEERRATLNPSTPFTPPPSHQAPRHRSVDAADAVRRRKTAWRRALLLSKEEIEGATPPFAER